MKNLFGILMLLSLPACGAANSSTSSANENAAFGEVTLVGLSNRSVSTGRGGYGAHFHVDVLVKNLAYEKQVNAVWTVDGWQTTYTCPLAFEKTVDANYELWGSDCDKLGMIVHYDGSQIAIAATMKGYTYWDNNGFANYDLWKANP